MLTRRQWLKSVIVVAGSVSGGGLLAGCSRSDDDIADDMSLTIFPQSVASGDPRPTSVLLWTRGIDPLKPTDDITLRLQVATDSDFAGLVVDQRLVAAAANDHCLKVRVVSLSPYTTYYYRFIYGNAISQIGRTRTAPLPESDVPMQFAYVSCQDYIGRYYNTYLSIIDDDAIDFVVFLGDYVYETTGDAQFQNTGGDRRMSFSVPAEASQVGPVSTGYLAATTVGNYRDLYKTVKRDRMLQRLHERFAVIHTWDDHEFSDDCFGNTATYYDGAANETAQARKQAAEQAFFEYVAIDQDSVGGVESNAAGAVGVLSAQLYPSTRIWRDFRFGAHLHLFMTDFRTHRPDHLIPEDAFPGQVIATRTELRNRFGSTRYSALEAQLGAYTDISADTARRADLRTALLTAYASALTERGLDPASMTTQIASWVDKATSGLIDVSVFNQYVPSRAFDATAIASMEKGLTFHSLFKRTLFGEVGTRYFVVRPLFELYAEYLAQTVAGGIGHPWGQAQLDWLTAGLNASTQTWKMVASSVPYAPMILDFSAEPAPLPFISSFYSAVPASLRRSFSFDVDHWDGFPQIRQTLVEGLFAENRVISISGDVHAAFVTQHVATVQGKRSYDFTGPAVSSATWAAFTRDAAQDVEPALTALVPLLDTAMVQATDPALRPATRSQIRYAGTNINGLAVVYVRSSRVRVRYHLFPADAVSFTLAGQTRTAPLVEHCFYDEPAAFLTHRTLKTFQVTNLGGLVEVANDSA